MGWFDKLLYNLGQVSPIGRAIEGAKQDDRLASLASQYSSAPDLATYAAIPAADNIYKPEHIVALEKLKEARKGVLQQQEAAPIAKMLSQWQAEGNDADPNFTGAEWVKGMATTDAGMSPEAYDTMKAGAIAGAKKGALPLSSFEANPVTAKLLQDAELAAQQKGTVARVFDKGFKANPMDMATLAMNKDVAEGFKRTTEGAKDIASEATKADAMAREQAALKVYNEHPTVQTPESRADLISKVIQAAGTWDVAGPILKRFDEAVNGPNLSVEQLTAKALNGDKDSQSVLDAIQARDIKKLEAARQVVVNNPLPAKVNVNQLDENEQAAINRAIGNGTLDPYKVNSRNQKTLAGVILANPDADLNALAAQLGVARNKDIIMKAGVAEMIPDILKKVVDAGKKLKYSDVEFIGKAQKWKNGQLNDPDLTRYMALRNDQLLTIGGVMRSNGMTDMAQKLEEEAMKPTLSPKALDGWLEGQLEAIDPRLNFYRSITKGNKAIPRSEYQTGTGVQGVNNLGKSKVAPVPASGVMKFDKYGNRVQ